MLVCTETDRIGCDFSYRGLIRSLGLDKMQKSMTTYVKSLSKRAEGDDREKTLPGGHLGSVMVTHSEDFEADSEFGNCLSSTSGFPSGYRARSNCP
jgi:hypothetical protein